MEIKEEKTTSSHLLSEEIKWIIVHYKKLGFSDSETAEIVKSSFNRPTLSRQSVKIVWNKYCNTAKVDNLWNKIGRPSILTEEDFEELEIFFQKNPKKSVNEAINSLQIQASRETVNRGILDRGLKAYRAPKKLYIRPENIGKRFEFALKMENKGLRYWKKIIFSDESSFPLINANGRILIRRFNDDQYDEDNIQLTSQCETLMVWGAISSKGIVPLVRIDRLEEGMTTLNGPRYLKLLQRYLLQNFPELKDQNLIFQHDNAPSHRFSGVKTWLEEKDILTLKWPPQSPDMNIIECIWNDLKYQLRGETFETKEDLWRRLKLEWKKIDKKKILGLYESMPDRIIALKEAEGSYTKY